ncbi:MAG: magnesium-translocating P-type ATPase [Proteobacteria bacterium]|nr:magnesium-translocating P-type ATPase [Pseudomonadota bacterium]
MIADRSAIPRRRVPEPTPLPERFWSLPATDVLAQLAATPAGLTQDEAARRRAAFGRNLIGDSHRRRLIVRIARRFADPLVAILIAAAAVSGLTGDWASFAIINVILVVSITLEIVQQERAENVVEALKRSVAVHVAVRRDGGVALLAVEDVVPGDIVQLEAGNLVPADGIVLEARDAHANESLLTGEPYPVAKRAGACAAEAPAEAFSALFSGTALVSGEATMLVTATGAQTRFGAIAAALETEPPPTAFERGLHAFGVLIVRITGFLVLFVLLAHLAFGRAVLDSFLFAAALAVGLTPELLPMIMTVTLSRGAQRMAKRKVVVKRLAAIHDLGTMDVLCTDKTGTLTEARMSLIAHSGSDGTPCARVLELAALNSHFETGIRTPLDDAIIAAATGVALSGWRRIADIPFDFERRRVSVLVERDGMRLLVIKGAPEAIIAAATARESGDGGVQPLDDAGRAALLKLHDAQIGQGRRCLGVAWRHFAADKITAADESELVFAGLCVFDDPPKASAAAAIARLEKQGVRVKIISGDAEAAVRHLMQTLGIPLRGSLTGAQIAELSDAALAARVLHTDLFARVSPDQKTRIIRALQARGHTVGFIGDGINDAPAIHAADAGLAVDTAADVARAAADLILLDPDLGVVADGVEEGRRTYSNIMKYLRMGTSSNFGNMLSMAAASLFIPFLPLTPIQVLLNNLLYDLSEVGIPFDRAEPRDIRKPHGWEMSELMRFTLIMGPLSSLFDLAIFVLLLKGFHAGADTFRTAWFIESMMTQILVIFAIRTALPLWQARPRAALTLTSLAALLAAFAFVLTPLGAPFGFVPVPGLLWLAIAALVAGYLVAAEILKRLAMTPGRHWRRRKTRHPVHN